MTKQKPIPREEPEEVIEACREQMRRAADSVRPAADAVAGATEQLGFAQRALRRTVSESTLKAMRVPYPTIPEDEPTDPATPGGRRKRG